MSTRLVILALVLGSAAGEVLHRMPEFQVVSPLLNLIGSVLFLGLLKVAVVPIVALSIFHSISSMQSAKSIKKVGIFAVVFYASTMLLAIVMGLILVTLIRPGDYLQGASADLVLSAEAAKNAELGVFGLVNNLINLALPSNFFLALSEGQILSIIVITIIFALGYRTAVGEEGSLVNLSKECLDTVMLLLKKLLVMTPLAVFCLIAQAVASTGFAAFGEAIGIYFLVVLAGLILHAVFTLNIILRFFTGIPIRKFAWNIRKALLTAFSTASSSATLPVTMGVLIEEEKVEPAVANLVLPLGSTINMDGTALYEAVAVVFLAQVFGIELSLFQLVVVALTASIAAIGAAGIPSAGLVTMVIVVDTVNQTLPGANIPIESVGLILGVDRILDMCRTAVNVLGDAVGCKIIKV